MSENNNISNNIKHYRYTKGLTQEELSVASGVALVTIKKIEGGSSGVRERTLDAIAAALGITCNVLLEPARKLSTIRFRSCRNMRSKESIISSIITRLDNYNRLEFITGDSLSDMLSGFETSGSVAEMALRLRAVAGLDCSSPIADMGEVVFRLGIKLFSVDVFTEKFFSLSVGKKDGGHAIIVNINERISYEQAVFSIAHEIGHFIMHSEKRSVISNEAIWVEEDEADLFASHFLMPQSGFEQYWNASTGLHWTDRVIKIKQIFGVHYKTVLFRLGNFDRIHGLFLKEYNDGIMKDDRDPEPLNRRLFTEERLYRLAINAINHGKITIVEGAGILNIDKTKMKKLVQSI